MFYGGNYQLNSKRNVSPEFSKATLRIVYCGGTVVKVLCYKSEGRWFDPSWCHWEFFIDIKSIPIVLWPLGSTQPLTEMSTRSISWGVKAAGAYA